MIINFRLDSDFALRDEITYILKTLGSNKSVNFQQAENGIQVGASASAQIRISERFISNYSNQNFSWKENLNEQGFVTHANGAHDYVSTALYMLCSLQEYDRSLMPDGLGRFQFSNSYQSELGISYRNVVQACFDKIAEHFNLAKNETPTRFFLTHDIDTVYESILQDGFYALRKGRFDIFLKLLFNVAIGKPDWLNMDQIMKLESEFDCRSTFFWIVKKGREQGLKNADYDFTSQKIQQIVRRTSENGFENGIHKSISISTFHDELKSFDPPPLANRYHYLKFNLPAGMDAIEQSGLKLDASLGFAENIGFRNSYGLPFTPYNVAQRKPYSFVEVPLHVMDTTLFKYNRSNIKDAEAEILKFFEANQNNSVLSVLWHNNFFSNYKYKGYLPLYKRILSYIRENNFKTIGQKEIIDRYSVTMLQRPS